MKTESAKKHVKALANDRSKHITALTRIAEMIGEGIPSGEMARRMAIIASDALQPDLVGMVR